MKIFPKIIIVLLLCILLQGGGYVGEAPNINDYFKDDRQPVEQEAGFIDIYKTPPSRTSMPDAQVLRGQLAPSTLTAEQIKILRPAKKPAYYDDLLAMRPVVAKLKTSVKSPDIQDFASCINVQKFYFDDFLTKYKNTPLAKQDIYTEMKDVNAYAQAILKQWRASEDNIKYVSYNAYNGAYQPSVIREKLLILDKKLVNLSRLVNSAE